MTEQPDWEGFGRDLCREWPTGDVDGGELFDLSKKYRLIREVPGGYDPEEHRDDNEFDAEPGDPWYEWNFHATGSEKDTSAFIDAIGEAMDTLREDKVYKAKMDDFVEEIYRAVEENFMDNLAVNVESRILQRCDYVIEDLLRGNLEMMKRYLKTEGFNGRSDHDNTFIANRAPSEFHPIIHGEFHENHMIELRKKIAEANAELIRDQRILDLEDQNKALLEHVNRVDRENERLREL